MGRVRTEIVSAVLVGWLVAACGGTPVATPSATSSSVPSTSVASPSEDVEETASPSPSGVADAATARLADLDYLVEQLKAIHPNPFLDEGEAAFLERVARIREDVASMTDAGFLVAVMDLMGHRERDGHSGAWAMATLEVCLAILQSSRTGREIELEHQVAVAASGERAC